MALWEYGTLKDVSVRIVLVDVMEEAHDKVDILRHVSNGDSEDDVSVQIDC